MMAQERSEKVATECGHMYDTELIAKMKRAIEAAEEAARAHEREKYNSMRVENERLWEIFRLAKPYMDRIDDKAFVVRFTELHNVGD